MCSVYTLKSRLVFKVAAVAIFLWLIISPATRVYFPTRVKETSSSKGVSRSDDVLLCPADPGRRAQLRGFS